MMEQQKNFLVCVDSDGCAMDTMDMKHIRCFGPCLVREWGLELWESLVLDRWNEINLYSITRGINRFKALVLLLKEIDGYLTKIPGLDSLTQWTDQADELSESALETYLEVTREDTCLKQALSWSKAVNHSIEALPEALKKAYPGVAEALEAIRNYADIAVVSSANRSAVMEEWERCGIAGYADIFLAQDAGSKAYCIQKLLERGYQKEHVLMIGDAKGDFEAASCNGILFYPILVNKESLSWKQAEEAVSRLISETYAGRYQEERIREFEDNLQSGNE